ncbi:LytR/AlgR family response regulator transcription factor [Pseudoflavitalea rhizosphaerae]|uniref:LytR/AlgR family response regulator transcription factor n=1 Tax=Pseudoflavitalea rhizosphaerae TaxID=1884793 RepID=UPI0013DE9C87|nr:LytTR family DNA-binding domain-containing protein [Pseudoflavitalea rhizosphaerae]
MRVQLSLNSEEFRRLKMVLPDCIVQCENSGEEESGTMMVPSGSSLPAFRKRFLVRKGKELISVHCNDIAYFYSRNKLSYLKTFDGKNFLVRMSLEEIEQCLSPDQFFRASRQVITSHTAVQKILLWFNGNLKVELAPREIDNVIVSRLKANQFRQWLGE